jgi:hypothetical protein
VAAGLVVALAGVVIYTFGKKKMDAAKPHLVPTVGIAPVLVGEGVSSTLTWRF